MINEKFLQNSDKKIKIVVNSSVLEKLQEGVQDYGGIYDDDKDFDRA